MKHDIDGRKTGDALKTHLLGRLDAVGKRLVAGCQQRVHVRTGETRDSYEYVVDEENARVLFGTQLLKGRFQEIGTEKMKTAPSAPIRRTLAEDGDAILNCLSDT